MRRAIPGRKFELVFMDELDRRTRMNVSECSLSTFHALTGRCIQCSWARLIFGLVFFDHSGRHFIDGLREREHGESMIGSPFCGSDSSHLLGNVRYLL